MKRLQTVLSQHVREKGKPICVHLSDGGAEANRLYKLRQEARKPPIVIRKRK